MVPAILLGVVLPDQSRHHSLIGANAHSLAPTLTQRPISIHSLKGAYARSLTGTMKPKLTHSL